MATRVVAAGMLASVALSGTLFEGRLGAYPRVPVVPLPEAAAALLVLPCLVILCASLLALALGRAGRLREVVSGVAAATAILLALMDATRAQPWAYLYAALLAASGFGPLDSRALRLALAGTYVWSGAQKLTPEFSREVLPWLLSPLPGGDVVSGLPAAGFLAAAVEMGAGLLLLSARGRVAGAVLAITMHAVILAALALHSYNVTVWPWNVTMVALIWISVRARAVAVGPARKGETLPESRDRPRRGLLQAVLTCLLCVILPALSLPGWWPSYLSFSLYSGNLTTARFEIPDATPLPAEVMAATAPAEVPGWRELTAHRWAMAEIGVPPFPEVVTYRALMGRLCELSGGTATGELDHRRTLTGWRRHAEPLRCAGK